MKKGFIWMVLTCLMVISMVLASCKSSSTTGITSTTNITTSSTTSTTSTAIIPTSTTSTVVATTAVTTTSTGNWWDSFGTPKYGGTLTVNDAVNPGFWDPNQGITTSSVECCYLDSLFGTDWTIGPSVQNYQLNYWDSSYTTGDLLQDWEFSSPSVLLMHIRQGVYWQNLPPANGREFNASDVVFHFDRMAGLGAGYTKPNNPVYFASDAWESNIVSVQANNNWTVTLTFNIPNPEFILENMMQITPTLCIENPETVQAYTNTSNPELTNWHNALGTGPFIVTDFIDNSSVTFVSNPNYWASDERHPQNKLPYVDRLKVLIIPNTPTAEAAMRAGKIDLMDTVSSADATNMKKTNPEIIETSAPLGNGLCIDPRNDLAPFNNVNVRKALQMAINLPEIASQYFGGGTDPSPLPLTSNYMTGWGFPYSAWPTSLQAEYAYNPTQGIQLLAAAGYPKGFNTDIVVDSSGPYQDLMQILQSEFASINVNLTVNLMTHAAFSSYVTTGHHNDALTYRNSGSLGLSTYPIRELMKFLTGSSSNDMMVSDPKIEGWYTAALNATNKDQIKQILMDENQYVVQQHLLISLVDPNNFYLSQPWLKGFSGQTDSTCQSGGPLLAFEWWSRFWIDR